MSSSWRASLRVTFLLATFVVVLMGPWARPAGAHAVLVSSSPGDGVNLDTAPTEVRLEFSEPISAQLGGLRVFDGNGDRVDRGSVEVVDKTIAVDLEGDLPDGTYVAAYRIVSADAHPVRGGIVFSVGDANASGVGVSDFLGDGADVGWEIVGAVARWMAMAGALVAAGGTVFMAF